MITEYKRPTSLEEALQLLTLPNAHPIGGGTVISKRKDEPIVGVDLQALGLDQIRKVGEKLEIGATATLTQLHEVVTTPRSAPVGSVVNFAALRAAIELETPLNLRNMGTVAGTLVACGGRSPFATALLALDARLIIAGRDAGTRSFGDFLPMRGTLPHGSLITRIEIPLNARFAFESVARTPKDSPIVCAALAQWPSGRTRLALGGFGAAPVLALDGNEPGGVEEAARNAFAEAGDEWATAEYRREIAAVLAKRCLEG